MSLYGQEPEVVLLQAFLPCLEHRSVIDVGAERGEFAAALLAAGAQPVHVIEPEPGNAEFLSRRFASDSRVHVHACAASSDDGEVVLHRSVDASGAPLTYGHTLLDRPDTDEIAWHESVTVPARSLASLADADEIPRRVGILKIDAEGHDLAVVTSLGDVEADVVMVEHWLDLPHSLGRCPWTSDEMITALRGRGFRHFAFIAHRSDFVIVQWDDASLPAGHFGNLVFVHETALDRVSLPLLERSSVLARSTAEVGEMYAKAASERSELIERAEREHAVAIDAITVAAAERLQLAQRLEHDLRLQIDTIGELQEQVRLLSGAAEERLALVERLDREQRLHLEAIRELEAQIERLEAARATSSAERIWTTLKSFAARSRDAAGSRRS